MKGRACGVATAIALVATPAADAATVGLRGGAGPVPELAVVGLTGEANRITLRATLDPAMVMYTEWIVSDAGAPIVPGDGCTPIDAHSVRCAAGPGQMGLPAATVDLGDMDDQLTVEGFGAGVRAHGGEGSDRLAGASSLLGGPGDDQLVAGPDPNPTFGAVLDGGPGDDRLVGGPHNDQLHGGGGRDGLAGGEGNDTMFDDDGDAARGPDAFDGGVGVDAVSYEARSTPVRVDLAARTSDEGDALEAVEAVTGGRGADRLAGDGSTNLLDGGPGPDRLSGRGGDDQLLGAGGPIACGSGRDTVLGGRSTRDLLEPDCEVLAPDHGAEISANPVVSRRRLRFVVGCPPNEDPDATSPVQACGGGQLRLRELGGRRRTLAVGRIPFGALEDRVVRARLTPLGRRLAARRRGVKAGVRIGGYFGPGSALRWAVRLKR
jgi:RTX calcium-binding nonapeptide repeat (4 copies)